METLQVTGSAYNKLKLRLHEHESKMGNQNE